MRRHWDRAALALLLIVLPALAGCPLDSIRDISLSRLFSGQKKCIFGDPAGCPAERVCAYVAQDRAECIERYRGSTPLIRFPFEPDHPVECIKGVATGHGEPGSHSWADTLYAIDLASRGGAQGLPGTVYTSMDGTALVYRSCPDNGTEKNCGNGFGNHVRILNSNGFVLLYAHLGQVWVEDSQTVRAGDPIGREGQSGLADQRHLHFSAHYQKIDSWLETLSYYRSHPGAVPPSIPFETQYCDPFVTSACLRKRSRMDELPCGPGNPNLAERIPLKGDWRD